MDRSGYPVEVAIALLILLAFLYLYRHTPDSAKASVPTTITSLNATSAP